jgi:hypothetical protein
LDSKIKESRTESQDFTCLLLKTIHEASKVGKVLKCYNVLNVEVKKREMLKNNNRGLRSA